MKTNRFIPQTSIKTALRCIFVLLAACWLSAALPQTARAAATLNPWHLDAMRAVLNNQANSGFNSGAVFIDNSGTILNPTPNIGSHLGLTEQIRIGSQSKTFISTIILKMVDDGLITLNDTIGSLVQLHNVDLGAAGLPLDSASLTVAQLLNMSSHIPNYMGAPLPGQDISLWDAWKQANYQAVPGVDHTTLASLGLSGYPKPFSAGLTGEYSNTNIIILSLIAEAVYSTDINTLLAPILASSGVAGSTYLPTTSAQGAIVTGSEAGQPITTMDPTIPWTSGAIVSTLQDQAKWLRELMYNNNGTLGATYADRMASLDPANNMGSLITMGGMPIYYGYGLFRMDLTGLGINLNMTGHGGSIAGYSNFFGWLNPSGYDLGLAVDTTSLTTVDNYGYYTNTPSEMLYLQLAHQLDYLVPGTPINNLNAARLDLLVNSPNILLNSASTTQDLTIGDGSQAPYFYLDLYNPDPIVATNLPTLAYYNDTAGAEIGVNATHNITISPNTNTEGYGVNFTLFQQNNATLTLQATARASAFGNQSTAVNITGTGSLTTAAGSRIYAQGGDATALAVDNSSGAVNVGGNVMLSGSGQALLVNNANVILQPGSNVSTMGLSVALNPNFTRKDPYDDAAYGVVLQNGGTLDSQANINAIALNGFVNGMAIPGYYDPLNQDAYYVVRAAGVRIDGSGTLNQTSGIISSTYAGVMLAGAGAKNVNLDDTFIAGPLYSIYGDSAASGTNTRVTGSTLVGNIDLGGGGGNSLTMRNSTFSPLLNENMPGAANVGTLDIQDGVIIVPVLNAPVFATTTLPLITGITTDNSTALPQIILPQMSRAIQFQLLKPGNALLLGFMRDPVYYQNLSTNRSLGLMLDNIAATYGGSNLNAPAMRMLMPLEYMEYPQESIAQLQPLSLAELTRSQLLQLGNRQKTMDSRHPLTGQSERGAGESPAPIFFFGDVYGQEIRQDHSYQEFYSSKIKGGGVFAGLGYGISDNWSVGGFVAFGQEDQDFSGNRGSINDTVSRFGAFVESDFGFAEMRLIASVGLHDVDYRRTVSYLHEQHQSSGSSVDFLGSASLKRDFTFDSFTFTPSVELAYIYNNANAYTENDGGLSALHVQNTNYTYLASSLGADLRYNILAKPEHKGSLYVFAGADWWHQYLDRPKVLSVLEVDDQFGFTTIGYNDTNDIFRARAGIGGSYGNFSGSLGYERLQGKNISGDELRLTLKYMF